MSAIAALLDVPENTVKSYLRRVRPRRLTPIGRAAIAAYVVLASVYGRRLAGGR